MKRQSLRVLAIASGGGHWVQLMRLLPVLAGHDAVFASTLDYSGSPGVAKCHVVPDANKQHKLSLLAVLWSLIVLFVRHRPHVVISTGAAPGLVALVLGRLTGARTIWLDSIANAEELSLSGKLAGRFADLWLTQWPHLAGAEGPSFEGFVL